MIQWAVYALPTTWQSGTGAQIHTFYFGLKNIYAGGLKDTARPGDAIAVFGTRNGLEKCLGFGVIDNDFDTLNMIIRADSLNKISDLKFRYWSYGLGCVKTLNHTQTVVLMDSNTTVMGRLDKLELAVNYNGNTFYTDGNSITPTVSDPSVKLAYKSSVSGLDSLSINKNNGTINPKLSDIGTYTVTIDPKEFCIIDSTIPIIIAQRVVLPDTSLIKFVVIVPACDTKGSIVLEGTTPENVSFRLFKIENGQNVLVDSSTTGRFSALKDGVYKIEIWFNSAKFGNYREQFTVTRPHCPNPVLNFSNASGGQNAIYLEKPGKAEIFNRDGKLIKTLQVPAEWNGTDQSGNDVPMGDYYLYINDQKEQVITVIR